MRNETFTIKEVGELLDIEQYVLRYYEKELKLNILRNTQGHRMYGVKDVELLKHIKELREQGLELKAIKNMTANLEQEGIESLAQITATTGKVANIQVVKDTSVDIGSRDDVKVGQFATLMKEMLKEALVEYNEDTKAQIKDEISEEIKDELSEEVNIMVNKKFMELEVAQKQKDEEYYKKLDETMREMQKMKRELAEIDELPGKTKMSFWKKIFGERDKIKEIDLQH
ncbi:MAG: helix-turn-helix domain-containing protein [Cellulosilyticaceae bacterium]